MSNIQDFISNLRQKLFIKSLITDFNADILAVGGVVRDLILNKPNKDIDLIVRKIPIDSLISHLQKFGRVDVVGKSFGVLKFIDSDGVDYDIALPRKEKPTGEGGYRGFDVQSDENLPIEADLIRRDAKLNAMAININTGKFIDPLGGLEDIEKKQISAANPEAFSDDPLRMLRIVAFASRFGFTIEPQTMQMIVDNAQRVKEIAPERILIELEKIVTKGNSLIGVQLLANTGLFKQIFGGEIKPSMLGRRDFNGVQTIGEFIFLMTYGIVQQPAAFFKENLKGDIDSYKEIKALEQAFDNANAENSIVARTIAHNMYVISPQSLQSQIIPIAIKAAVQELLQGKYPKTVNELAVNGNDLGQLGLKGKEIGDAQKMLLLKIYSDAVENNKEELLSLLGRKSALNESRENQVEYGALMLFLNISNWKKLTLTINEDDVYEKNNEFGVETEPHVTILYGFHSEVTADEAFDLFKENFDLKPIKISVKGISIFENEEFDVVKIDVDEGILNEMNAVMRKLPNTTTFPKYNAHITISYVKKGTGKKYIKEFKKDLILTGNKLVFSTKKEKKNFLDLGEGDKLKESIEGNGQPININFFVKKYDEWNQGRRFRDPSKESVLRFLEDEFPDLIFNDMLRQGLLWKLTDRDVLNENVEMNNIAYSAIVLDEASKQKLIKVFSKMIPEGYEVLAHHMTLNLGAIDPKYAEDLDKEIELNVIDYAIDDKVMAVGVEGYPTNNKKAHITLAVNRQGGGKPMMSNNLTEWRPIEFPLVLKGIVTQIRR